MFLINFISHGSPSFLSGCNMSYYKIFWRDGNFCVMWLFRCVGICCILPNQQIFVNILLLHIVKISLQPDEMTSLVGFGPRAVVWDSYFIASMWRMEVIYYYVLYILTGCWFAHCQLTQHRKYTCEKWETAYGMKFLKLWWVGLCVL